MSDYELTVFEVFDNFLGSQECPVVESLSDEEILEFRGHIIDFYAAYKFAPRGEYETRLYLGGFLSSPPFSIEASPYVSSALLHSDSVVLFDPLHYWLCDEQYHRRRLMSAPTGWRDLNTRQPNLSLTRRYMSTAFEWLYSLRPLVEAGIVILIPAERIVYARLEQISNLSTGVTRLIEPIEELSEKFSPEEVTVDDNRKGLFTFAGGNREPQVRRAIGQGIEQFAKDVVVANATESFYTAPFRWEQHLGKTALDGFAAAEYHATIVEGLRNLRLPILANLSSDVLLKIHKDSKYTEFRTKLREALQSIHAEIGSQDFVDRVAQIEKDVLLPKVEAIHRETESSGFRAATNAVKEGIFTFVQTFLGNIVTGLDVESNLRSGAITGGLSFLREIYSEVAKSRDRRIWAQLLPETPSLSVYGPPLTLKQQGGVGWEIDDKPSMSVKVSRGIYKLPIHLNQPK